MQHALRVDEIDGIFMDKYMASYMVYKMNDSDFKVFTEYRAEIPYELAHRNTQFLNDEFKDDGCAGVLLSKSDVDGLLIKYLKPVEVGNNLTYFYGGLRLAQFQCDIQARRK